jgi:hypothetical protein
MAGGFGVQTSARGSTQRISSLRDTVEPWANATMSVNDALSSPMKTDRIAAGASLASSVNHLIVIVCT